MALKTLLIFLFVAIIAISVAEAQKPILGNIIHVNGTLYCTANGSPGANGNATPVFPNATVQVACTGGVVANSPMNATSDPNGVYWVVLFPQRNATVDSIISNCRLFVLTPLPNCNLALPPAGLVSNLLFVKTEPSGFFTATYMVAAGFTPSQA